MSATGKRLIALRGATSVEANAAGAIGDATVRLMGELMERNDLTAEDMVSCIFTVTPDLDAEFPAAAVRSGGLGRVPLLCAVEIGVRGALERIVRVMVHCYLNGGREPVHVYLGEAKALRSDLASAQ